MKTDIDKNIYRSIVENSIDAVVIADQLGNIVFWNDASEKLFGYSSSEVIGEYVHDVLPAYDLRDKANKSFNEFKKKGTGPVIGNTLQIRGLKKNGDEVHVQFSPNTIEVDGKLYIFAFLRDISDLIILQEKLRVQATVDELTGLLNRRSYIERTEIAFSMSLRHKQPLSLLMMDIDNFKKINDKYGHLVGDIMLKAFSSCVSRSIRSEDILARVGGEEFIVAMGNSPIDAALLLAERIRLEIESLLIDTSGHKIRMTVSIGVSSIKSEDRSLEQLQHRCDKALYKAKNSGRNSVELA
ncbi:MAG: diguanylate cyclase [Candidatus Brocadiaceae bacterium]|nr:diguanylate cyclase [Candidatus Brocadiaceae bacterium]